MLENKYYSRTKDVVTVKRIFFCWEFDVYKYELFFEKYSVTMIVDKKDFDFRRKFWTFKPL